MNKNFSRNGLIGKSGKWYPCGINEHTPTAIENKNDAPFAIVRTHFGDSFVEFEDYYTVSKTLPTTAQFETLMSWCTATGEVFEDVTDCWNLPWEKWRGK